MIQVDVFWSFAMGACFAACAPEGIRRSNSMFVNKYFVCALAYLSMIFAPSGVYLLWHFTGWETMFFFDKTLHGIWPCIFAVTNVLLGVIGFCVCYKLIKTGRALAAHGVWTTSYIFMFAILTFGYDRFLYAGSLEDWRNGKKYELVDFIGCEVFYTLLVMGVFVLPPLYYVMTIWPAEYGLTKPQKREILHSAMTPYVAVTLVVAAAYLTAKVLNILPVTIGYHRLIAFLVGQVIFGLTIFTPLLCIPLRKPRKVAGQSDKNGSKVAADGTINRKQD